MEIEEESSLPYIDDIPSDDEATSHNYNLKIIENYNNRNRNIEITRLPHDDKSSRLTAPLAEEVDLNENRLSDSGDDHVCKYISRDPGMKLIIRGWNSNISIQGLDNKSSITFKRKCDKSVRKIEEERKKSVKVEEKTIEKTRKGRWKMLTKSIMLAKSARFERKGLDERYPKYVLLKNEEEEVTKVKEYYPKMFGFNEKETKQSKKGEPKSEFSFKKSFKNKTEPIMPLDQILNAEPKPKLKEKKLKKPLTERNVIVKKKMAVERRRSMNVEKPIQKHTIECSTSQGQVYNEIQGIIEDTLKLYPQELPEETSKRNECYSSVPPQCCQFPCNDPCCCLASQPPHYIPVYPQKKQESSHLVPKPPHVCHMQPTAEGLSTNEEVEIENLSFGILSSFFPRVVIMNAVRDDFLREEKKHEGVESSKSENAVEKKQAVSSLEIPKSDRTAKSKMISEIKTEDQAPEESKDNVNTVEEDQISKSQESETTEYLQYSEFDFPENEAVDRTTPSTSPLRLDSDKTLPADKSQNEDHENLSLTEIGYKMYDSLTKLSLNREKDSTKKTEVAGCGYNGNETKNLPYNITLESNNSVVKVTVPENELNFQIVNSKGGDIQIGVMSAKKEKREEENLDKVIVRKDELWHCDGGSRAVVLKNDTGHLPESKGFQKVKVCLAESKEVVLSIEMNEKENEKEEKMEKKSTKEMKVGTDDFDLAGGDFVCAFGGNSRNLSPRIGQLLKRLHEKLEFDEKQRKYLDDKINQKLIDDKYQNRVLPGVFLVKHISPRPTVQKPAQVPSLRKTKNPIESREKGLREYYCEDCLATMRIFEDENPSVKSIVDKFETIIQLESF